MAYFPNGIAGEVLQEQCSQCPMGRLACPTAATSMLFNYDQLQDDQEKLQEAMTILVAEDGSCETFKLLCHLKLAPIAEAEERAVPLPATILPSMVGWAKERGLI